MSTNCSRSMPALQCDNALKAINARLDVADIACMFFNTAGWRTIPQCACDGSARRDAPKKFSSLDGAGE